MTASGQCNTCVASSNTLCHEHRRESLMGMGIRIEGRRKSSGPFIKCNLTCICTLQNSQALLCGYFWRYLRNSHLKFCILALLAKYLRYLPLSTTSVQTATIQYNGHHHHRVEGIDQPGCNPLVTRCNLLCDVCVVCPHYATHPLHRPGPSLTCGLSNE